MLFYYVKRLVMPSWFWMKGNCVIYDKVNEDRSVEFSKLYLEVSHIFSRLCFAFFPIRI